MAFAQTDTAEAGRFAPAAQNDLIAVLEKTLDVVGRALEQAAAIALFRSGDGAGSDEIAGANGASVGRVVGDHLAQSPIERGDLALADAHTAGQAGSSQPDFQVDAVGSGGRAQMRKGFGIASGSRRWRAFKGSECLTRDNPRRYRSSEILTEERSEGLVFPS